MVKLLGQVEPTDIENFYYTYRRRLGMNEIEMVQSLIDSINKLPHRDENELYAIRVRAQMLIRNIFGDSSEYLENINHIYFSPNYLTAEENLLGKTWNDGKDNMLNLFNTMLEHLSLFGTTSKGEVLQTSKVEASNRVFVVHGYDEGMKETVARMLGKIGLDPIILHEKPNEGRTIIEKFTEYSDVSFAVILLSPDDMAYSKDYSSTNAKPRARQNVVFELGFFIGKLGRNRVLVLYKEEDYFEMPSDYSGVLYTLYDSSGRWQFDLVKELQASSYDVDANKLL